MGIARLFFLCFVLIIMAGCAPKVPDEIREPVPQPGEFYTGDGQRLSPQELVRKIKDKDFVLLGESHNNPCDHKVQAKVMDLLAESGVDFILGMEMVDVSRQDILDSFNRGEISIEELPDSLDWRKTWGYDFELYRPVFESAKKHGIPVKALNLPSEVTRSISHYGLDSLDEQKREYLPEKVAMPPEEQLSFLEEQYEMHQGFVPEDRSQLQHFIQAQSTWDSKMAEMAVQFGDEHSVPVVVLAGSEHVRMGWGIEHRLMQQDADARVARVLPLRDVENISPDNPLYFYCPPVQHGRMRLGLVMSRQGDALIVRGVVDDSAAARAGFMKGDEIVSAGGEPVREMSDLHEAAVKASETGEPVMFQVLRKASVKSLKLELPGEE